MVCTPAQLPRHLLTSNSQLRGPIFVLLEDSPQQDTLFPLPVNIIPMAIHPFFMLLLSPPDLIFQVFDNGFQLFDLPPQCCHLVIIAIVLEGGLVSYSSKEYASRPPTCAMFPLINLHSHSPIAAEYLIALVAPSFGLSITPWSKRP